MDGSLTVGQRATARAQHAVVAAALSAPAPAMQALAGRPILRDGQRLHPEPALFLRLRALNRPPELSALTPAQARTQMARDVLTVRGRLPTLAAVSEVTAVRGRLYDPGGARGLLVYFHGGGFVTGDLDTHDATCRWLALAAGARVLSVDYRRAPEHRFPAAAQDAWSAFAHARTLVADGEPIAVGGDSAGGNLAAGVAQRAAREGGPAPALQLLLYPWLDLSRRRASHELFGDGFYLTNRDLDWYAAHYLGATGRPEDPACSPLLAEDLAGVAPAFIATAGFDPLRDEGEEYAWRLREAGVRAALARHSGLIHGFASVTGAGRTGREALMSAAGALRLALA